MVVNKTRCQPGSSIYKFQVWCATALKKLLTTGSVSMHAAAPPPPPPPNQLALQIDDKRLNLEICRALQEEYPDDPVTTQVCKDAMMNMLQSTSHTSMYYDLSRVLREMGVRIPPNLRGSLGRYISKRWQAEHGTELGKTSKHCNGSIRDCIEYREEQLPDVKRYIEMWLDMKELRRSKPRLEVNNSIRRYFTSDDNDSAF